MKRYIIYLITIFILLVSIEYFKLFQNYRDHNWWRKKLSGNHDHLYTILKQCIPLIEESGIEYWMHCGTLLGAVRHNDFIPWDDDIDLLIVRDNDFDRKINTLKSLLDQNGYVLQDKFFGYVIHSKQDKDTKFFGIDLFVHSIKGDKTVGTDDCTTRWPKEFYYTKDVFPLTELRFRDINVKAPNRVIESVKHMYGENCLKEAVIYIPHINGSVSEIIVNIPYITARYLMSYLKMKINI